MPEKIAPDLKDVAETLLIPLYIRALETKRPDALIRDEKAAGIVERMDCDFSKLRIHGVSEQSTVLRLREFDRMAHQFLGRNPHAAVVHIGCGLDTRFERVDDGQVEWFDLDLPNVIDLRRSLIGGEGERYHLLSGSVFENAWMEALAPYRGRAFLFMAEGVFPYFTETQIKTLVRTLREQFPGAELVLDGISPYVTWVDNLRLALTRVKARLHWSLKHAGDLENWAPGISLEEAWYFLDHPEPRLKGHQWMMRIPFFAKSVGVYRYRLGDRP